MKKNNYDIKRRNKELSDSVVIDTIGEDTREHVRRSKVAIKVKRTPDSNQTEYSKRNEIVNMYFHMGYDLLQYNIAAKPYIMKKYSLKKEIELDIILYLFPIQYFTHADFKLLPLNNTGYSFKKLREMNMIVEVIQGKKHYASKVYSVSEKHKKAVIEYYKILSGQKTPGKTDASNPFKSKDAAAKERKMDRLLDKLKDKVSKGLDVGFKRFLHTK